jgi:Tol biopolymer transport system component
MPLATRAVALTLVFILGCGSGSGPDGGGGTTPTGHIAFTSARLTGSRALFIMNASSGASAPVSSQAGVTNDYPALSPDGTKIAFSTNRDGNYEIYLINTDGTGTLRLTNDPGGDIAPAWSPSGTQLVYVRIATGSGLQQIIRMNADGSSPTPLTVPGSAGEPAWSPDGSTIVYGQAGELWTMNADGSNQTLLFDDLISADQPAWSPDGEQIAFAGVDANQDIFIINADGSGLRNLTNTASGEIQPTWSPDGDYIAFNAFRNGNNEIARRKVDGSDEVLLSPIGAEDQHPSWSE